MNKKEFTAYAIEKLALPMAETGLHLVMPNMFELYLVALEVRDDDDNFDPVKEMFVFPVNPDSIMLISKTITSVKKTFNGAHVNVNKTFNPFPISLNGTFGRGIRTVITKGSVIPVATGYGAMKILEGIIAQSKDTNEKGKSYRLILHLLPFGESYTIEVNECKFNMTMEKNRLWYYDLMITAVAPGNINNNFVSSSVIGLSLLQKLGNAIFRTTTNNYLKELF